jgi:ESS family glutamate:Na+ symporter
MDVSRIELGSQDTFILSLLVLFLGYFINNRIRFLNDNNIPQAVSGGLLCSVLIALLYQLGQVEVVFDMALRDFLLLAFFSSIGLKAKMSMLRSGGTPLLILLVLATVLLVLQNLTGIAAALGFDSHPAYGLLAGSIPFAGGHGTAIAWGKIIEEAGLPRGNELSIACATFGLIAGGLIGGPVAGRLIQRYRLQARDTDQDHGAAPKPKNFWEADVRLEHALASLLMLALCIAIGGHINEWLSEEGVRLPSFLTAMGVGILITNLADLFKIPMESAAISRGGEISLYIFLSMSLMNMQLWLLASAIGPILVILLAQILVIVGFTVLVVFRVMGRDYDAAVISAGFLGIGLGATPVAMANMQSVSSHYGPSTKAFLIVPLIGAFFIDISNAVIIELLLSLEMMALPN